MYARLSSSDESDIEMDPRKSSEAGQLFRKHAPLLSDEIGHRNTSVAAKSLKMHVSPLSDDDMDTVVMKRPSTNQTVQTPVVDLTVKGDAKDEKLLKVLSSSNLHDGVNLLSNVAESKQRDSSQRIVKDESMVRTRCRKLPDFLKSAFKCVKRHRSLELSTDPSVRTCHGLKSSGKNVIGIYTALQDSNQSPPAKKKRHSLTTECSLPLKVQPSQAHLGSKTKKPLWDMRSIRLKCNIENDLAVQSPVAVSTTILDDTRKYKTVTGPKPCSKENVNQANRLKRSVKATSKIHPVDITKSENPRKAITEKVVDLRDDLAGTDFSRPIVISDTDSDEDPASVLPDIQIGSFPTKNLTENSSGALSHPSRRKKIFKKKNTSHRLTGRPTYRPIPRITDDSNNTATENSLGNLSIVISDNDSDGNPISVLPEICSFPAKNITENSSRSSTVPSRKKKRRKNKKKRKKEDRSIQNMKQLARFNQAQRSIIANPALFNAVSNIAQISSFSDEQNCLNALQTITGGPSSITWNFDNSLRQRSAMANPSVVNVVPNVTEISSFSEAQNRLTALQQLLIRAPSSIPRNFQNSLRPIVIDGSNVARSHGSTTGVFSCRGIAIAIEHFLIRGHAQVTAFVPQFRRNLTKQSPRVTDQWILEKLANQQLVAFTPSRTLRGQTIASYDDRFIVDLASINGGVVVSNDNFRDIAKEDDVWRQTVENRLLMYVFVGDVFMIPEDPFGRNGVRLRDFLSFQRS